MTVAELLQVPTLNGLKLLAGSLGLHQEISTVTVIDTPDGFQWLSGNEVVITTTFALNAHPNDLFNFVSTLIAHKVSALVLKTDRYLKIIPEEIKTLCEEENCPLIYCPDRYAFADIINPALSSIISKQAHQLRESSKIHASFLELAVNDRSIQEILQTLSQIIRQPTAYVDTIFQKVYFSDTFSSKEAAILQELSYEKILEKCKENYEMLLVANKEQDFGFIIKFSQNSDFEHSSPDSNSNIYKTAIEYACIVIILHMQILISKQMIEEKYLSTFVSDLMLNNVKTREEIETRAHLYGWELNGGAFVVIIDINNIKKYYLKELDSKTNEKLKKYTKRIFDISIKYMQQDFPNARYYSQSDFIAFLITGQIESSTKPALKNVFLQIQHSLKDAVPFTVSMGVGGYVDDCLHIHKSYQQAQQVIQVIYQLQQFNSIFFFDQIGIYQLLFPLSESLEASEFCKKYIQPLQEYDARHHANLIETLLAIINCGWNLKAASKELFLHYNSVKYRFQKISEILDIDLSMASHHTEIELALKLYLIQKQSDSLFLL